MTINKVTAIRLTWQEVSDLIQHELEKILGYRIICRTQKEDAYYWCACFTDMRMQLSDVYKVIEIVGATHTQCVDSIPAPEDHVTDVNCLGMAVCELLLQYGLHHKWEETHIGDGALWLLNVHDIQQ